MGGCGGWGVNRQQRRSREGDNVLVDGTTHLGTRSTICFQFVAVRAMAVGHWQCGRSTAIAVVGRWNELRCYVFLDNKSLNLPRTRS